MEAGGVGQDTRYCRIVYHSPVWHQVASPVGSGIAHPATNHTRLGVHGKPFVFPDFGMETDEIEGIPGTVTGNSP